MELKYKLVNRQTRHPEKHGHDSDPQLTAGIDLYSNVRVRINTNSYAQIGTGVAFQIPRGYFGLLKEKSGFTARTGTKIGAGVIDSNYTGEIIVILSNPTEQIVDIRPGDGICQMLILPIPEVTLKQVDTLTPTERGEKGFGSTDV